MTDDIYSGATPKKGRQYKLRNGGASNTPSRNNVVEGYEPPTTEELLKKFPTTVSLFEEVVNRLFNANLTTVQKEIINCLTGVEPYEPFNSIMIMAWRGASKSLLASIAIIDFLIRNPEKKVLFVSARPERARQSTEFVKQILLLVPELNCLLPMPYQRRGTKSFDISIAPPAHMPSLMSAGIFQVVTGFRTDYIIYDDIEVKEYIRKGSLRERLYELINLRTPNAKMLFLGTWQKPNSIYLSLYDEGIIDKGYLFPVLMPQTLETDVDGWNYGDIYHRIDLPANSTIDERFPDEVVADIRKRLPADEFVIQYLLRKEALFKTDQNSFSVKRLIIAELGLGFRDNPPLSVTETKESIFVSDMGLNLPIYSVLQSQYRWARKILVVDPSGTGADSDTAFVVMGISNGMIYVLDYNSANDGYSNATLAMISNMAKKWAVDAVYIETHFGGAMFSQLLQPILLSMYICAVELFSVPKTKQESFSGKLYRIITQLTPIIEQQRIVFDKGLMNYFTEERRSLSLQLLDVSNYVLPDKTDVVDCIASGVFLLTPLLNTYDKDENPYRIQQGTHIQYKDRTFQFVR